MTDEPEQGTGDGNPPLLNNVTKWIGGLTAVVLALAGLKAAAGQLDLFGSGEPAEAEQAATADEGGAPATAAAGEEEASAELPTKYTGTWEGQDVTLELRNGVWVETLGDGTVTRYEQLSRDETTTNGIDRSRNLYVRWPTSGGTLEESEDNDTWTRSYEVTAA